ncbi:MAG: hypothetical protein DRQ78_08475 [Epsilonproteobacteria bacterium]|nr:MAG: hypothetical protein DRQ78_08475 [Campylobacterota bacterium]
MIMMGMLTAVGLVAITAKFSKSFLQKILGYDWLVDTIVTLGLPILLAGTYSGAMSMVITGLCVSVILWISKNIIGYQKYGTIDGVRKWHTFEGTWTIKYIAKKFSNTVRADMTDAISDFKEGWNDHDRKREAMA